MEPHPTQPMNVHQADTPVRIAEERRLSTALAILASQQGLMHQNRRSISYTSTRLSSSTIERTQARLATLGSQAEILGLVVL